MYRAQDPPNRYISKTLIGNWFEERVLEKSKADDCEFGKYSFDLKSTKNFSSETEKRLYVSMLKAPHSFISEGQSLKSGMNLMLSNAKSNVFLAVDSMDKRKIKFSACGSSFEHPIRRNVFHVEKVLDRKTVNQIDVLCYGDKIRLSTFSKLFDAQLFLTSTLVPYDHPVRSPNHQEVYFSIDETFNSTWQIENCDFEKRFKNVQEEVKICDFFLLKNCSTGKLLSVGELFETNAFGKEQEVFAENMETRNKSQNLLKEMIGLKGAELVSKNYLQENQWRFVSAKNKKDDFDERVDDACVKGLIMLEDVIEKFFSAGCFTFNNFKNAIAKIDSNKTGKIDVEDCFWCMKNCGVIMSPVEFGIFLDNFKIENNCVMYEDFYHYFEILENGKKQEMTDLVIKQILKNYPTLRFENLIKMYNCFNDNKEEVNKFVKSWPDKKVVDSISEDEMKSFFKNVSLCVRNEKELCEIYKRFVS